MIAYEHDSDCGWLPGFYKHHSKSGHRCPDIKCAFLHTIARRICPLCATPIGYSRCYVRPPGHFRLYHTDCVDHANGPAFEEVIHYHVPMIPRRPTADGAG